MDTLHNYLGERTLVLEGLEEGIFKSLTDSIKKQVSIASDEVKKTYSTFGDFVYSFGKLQTPSKIVKLRRDLPDIISKRTYQDIHTYRVPTIPGLAVDLVTLTNALNGYFSNYDNIYNEIDRLDTLISELLATSGKRKSFKKTSEELSDYRKKFVDEPKKNFKGFFDPRDYRESTKLETLIYSNDDLITVTDNLITIDSYIDDKSIMKLNKIINNIYKKTLMLTEDIDSGVEYSNVGLESLIDLLDIFSKSMTTVSTYFFIYSKTMDLTLKLPEVYER
jgi:hypothetical protein